MNYDELLQIEPYSLAKEEKEMLLTERLTELTELHKVKCTEYNRMLSAISYDEKKVGTYKDIPFLPVRLFKDMSLKSVPDDAIVKTMTSSGTTGQQVSKIYLDRATASNQQKTMVKIVSSFTGSERMPMIIIDCPSVIKDRNMFSARGAGILGFSIFGSKKIYALDDNMHLNVDALKEFLETHKGKRILLFGFTFMIWQYFYAELARLKSEGVSFDLSNAVMIHGGGWKKLINEAVTEEEFHRRLEDVCGLSDIHDYYGMVEQTGCIYMECECGHLHASIFSDVLVRNPRDFAECAIGEKGIVQVVSAIPESYPGHSLLTEDEGVILGEDDCPCGRKGKYFKILGRIKAAEIRGCSDTFAAGQQSRMSKGNAADKTYNAVKTDEKILGILDETSRIDFLVGNRELLQNINETKPLSPFDDTILEFTETVSKKLLSNKANRAFSDVITLGFWLRKASVLQYRNRYEDKLESRLGRGVLFHIAPSNVPVNYAYSLFTGLLTGNANIVRVPSKKFAQVDMINAAILAALEEHPEMKPYIILVRYERDKSINDYLSSLADVRVIWGGDRTIEELQKSPQKGGATEVLFADRYSLAVIDSDYYFEQVDSKEQIKQSEKPKDSIDSLDNSISWKLDVKAISRIANDFYNDTYLSDQNACTSPRVVVWTGTKIAEAQSIFWKSVKELADKKYSFQTIQGVDKITNIYEAAAMYDGNLNVVNETNNSTNPQDNSLIRANVDKLTPALMDYRGNSGLFYEYSTDDLTTLYDFCNDTHCQTIGLMGDKDILEPLQKKKPQGIYRIVKLGHTMDFDFEWDGYDLFECLTS
ncbi:Phenylacetate-coenzyme A ligase PaaK, adenylate-forming domain family [Lachnospiraceae bacterium NE2001]|nr:Phenylacetate-coenzyme A ligase PaaK, adenylate-forming domain family [Lachnospiraceae bacterium NE2001]